MNKEKKKKIVKLLKTWGNMGLAVKNYKMQFRELMEICSNLKDIRAVCYENMSEAKNKKIVSNVENSVINSMEYYENRMEKLNKKLEGISLIREEVEACVKKLDALEQIVLRAKFVGKITWEQVPSRLSVDCSLRQCYRIYDSALEKLENLVSDELLDRV